MLGGREVGGEGGGLEIGGWRIMKFFRFLVYEGGSPRIFKMNKSNFFY